MSSYEQPQWFLCQVAKYGSKFVLNPFFTNGHIMGCQ